MYGFCGSGTHSNAQAPPCIQFGFGYPGEYSVSLQINGSVQTNYVYQGGYGSIEQMPNGLGMQRSNVPPPYQCQPHVPTSSSCITPKPYLELHNGGYCTPPIQQRGGNLSNKFSETFSSEYPVNSSGSWSFSSLPSSMPSPVSPIQCYPNPFGTPISPYSRDRQFTGSGFGDGQEQLTPASPICPPQAKRTGCFLV